MDSALRCERLSCGYSAPILQDVNLTFAPGEVTAIIGPNGSGKSTFLKTLSGLIRPLAGEVRIDNRLIQDLSFREIALKIATVPQEENIPFRFTAREIVAMGRIARSSGLAETAEDSRIIEEAMRFTDSFAFADRPIHELSGGEKQRVTIARALAQEAEILLLDEPTTHLDLTHQLEICRIARDLAKEGKTILSALHDLNMVGAMADRAVLLGDGRVKVAGEVNEVLSSPQLDETYKVSFERMERGGRIVVLPPLA